MMGDYFGGGYGFMGGGFGFFLMILFWGLIIWVVVALVQAASGGRLSGGSREDEAMKTLRERYAKGEITKEQFDQMKKDLGV